MPAKAIADKWEKVRNSPGLYSKRRSDGSLWVRWRTPGDPKRGWTSVVVNNVEEGKREYHKNQAKPRRKTVPSNDTFIDYATKWIDTHPTASKATKRKYHASVRLYMAPLHKLKMQAIETEDIRDVLEGLRDRLAPATLQGAVAPLSAILTSAKKRGHIFDQPFANLEERERPKVRRKEKRILSAEQVAQVMDAADDVMEPLLAVLLFAGLRISEAIGLTWGDVDFKKSEIHVRRQLPDKIEDAEIDGLWVPLKGDRNSTDTKERYVEMPGLLRSKLLAFRGDRIAPKDALVFTLNEKQTCGKIRSRIVRDCAGGLPLTQNYVGGRIRKIARELELDKAPAFTAHQCRHNYASILIAKGNDVGYVSDQLGHASPVITLLVYRSEFKAAREKGSGAAAIDAFYGEAMR